MWLCVLFPALHQVGVATDRAQWLHTPEGNRPCYLQKKQKKQGLQYAQVLSSAVLYWLIEQISYFLPSYSCNYPLAKGTVGCLWPTQEM